MYIENPEKTENPEYWESGAGGVDLQGMVDVMEFAMTDERVAGLTDVLAYATTERQYFVSALNCAVATAREEMSQTKQNWNKPGGNTAYHAYQAFKPGEVSPETAHEIGVRLAQTLWGERFEVVIATHLDRGHLHNHFVLNSVSFKDGYKFYDSKNFYRMMQRESDALCREYALSVVEQPKYGVVKHHEEIRAEREGRPTWRGSIKAEVDEAISQSMTEDHFVANLKKRGYEVKLGKDISVCPPGKERFFRLARNFGETYSRQGLMRQMRAQGRPQFPAPEPQRRIAKMKCRGKLKIAPKLSGFRALYFHYLYLMGKLPAHRPRPPAKVHFLYREDLLKIDRISNEIKLLFRHRIDTAEQLFSFKGMRVTEMSALAKQRQGLRNKLRRMKDGAAIKDTKGQIALLSTRIGALRKEVGLCDDIAARSVRKDKMAKVAQEQQNQNLNRKEKTRHEPFR